MYSVIIAFEDDPDCWVLMPCDEYPGTIIFSHIEAAKEVAENVVGEKYVEDTILKAKVVRLVEEN